jgi:hypothetical protein
LLRTGTPFVLGLVVLHLWLFRRGEDILAGISLAVAICLKMTPALFLLYWLYQRNWKLAATTMIAGFTFVALVPLIALGPTHYSTLMSSWWTNLIGPALLKGRWFPMHINQSLSGVMSRYFLTGPDGDIFYNPDDYAVYGEHPDRGWITLLPLSPQIVKMLLRSLQVAVVAAIAWAIGWRRLPRDDGRRMLHYGMITLGMMLLNQRTWMHHATVVLVVVIAIWQAIAFGRMRRARRRWALALMFPAGALLWLSASDLYTALARLLGRDTDVGKLWADYVDAYGPTFWYFMILLIISILLSRSVRNTQPPYANRRQTLSDHLTPP